VIARLPPLARGFGILGLFAELLSLATMRALPQPAADPDPRLSGVTAVVVPGLFMTDWSTRHVRKFLSDSGCVCVKSGLNLNIGPTRSALAALETTLTKAIQAGGPIVLIGHSLGGTMLRALAERQAGKIIGLVTTSAPIRVPVETPLAPAIWLLSLGYAHKRLEPIRHKAETALAIPIVAIHADRDGIVDKASCWQDEDARCTNIIVRATHMTVCSTPETHREMAKAIRSWFEMSQLD
jgi:pimeloyl-ACP methyl ester carboxylesterase